MTSSLINILPIFWQKPPEVSDPMRPGMVSLIAGQRNSRNRVRAMVAVIEDPNDITSINAVTFRILRSDKSIRYTHTTHTVATTLPARRVVINASGSFTTLRASPSNLISVTINYTDSTGTYDITNEGNWQTDAIDTSPPNNPGRVVDATIERDSRDRSWLLGVRLDDVDLISRINSVKVDYTYFDLGTFANAQTSQTWTYTGNRATGLDTEGYTTSTGFVSASLPSRYAGARTTRRIANTGELTPLPVFTITYTDANGTHEVVHTGRWT